MSVANIKHCGEVVRVADDKVWVRMTVNSACSGCHARAVCGVDESKDKIVEVATSDAAAYSVGESVEVALESRSVGAKSVFLAYVVPFFVLLIVLVGLTVFGVSEGVAALSAIVGVGLYYVVLWLMNSKIEKTIKFIITKQTK
ncbi:MAG: SoxR reducing system RseC family protein [Alistipes sp.]|jgi:sigma-E factor negative regulatory protein RseC|nr:SoxR reducing system RseC family protein [Alistipes sp.]MBQ5875112.1 SoxR reducing system RseC family protein [Alistipes sp.]MBR5484412.1 SoxR reducing system RseC family protein [Alistipes sp.]